MWRSPMVVFALLASCSARTQLPIVEDEVEIHVPTHQLVCHIRSIATAQKLSFHYGTFANKATFRLIGPGFELTAYNPGSSHTYVLEAYDMSADGKGTAPARDAFDAFRAALKRPIDSGCSQ